MASTHKSLRSGTANKRPTTSIADGQIALNTNTTSPGLFFKDSTGATIIKVGPVHVGTTAPNASPAAGGSAGNSVGEIWLDTSLTPVGVKIWNGSAFVNATPIGSTTVQGLLELATSAETQTGTDTDRAVTPAGLQSKVSDSTSTTSSTTIASSTAVKSAYDLANAALPKSGGTVTGNLEIGTTGSLSFEGATADAFETTIAVTDPTADRTITLPDTTGTVVTTGDTGTVTSTMIADGTIVDGDISASAEIAVSKLADGTARQLLQTDAAGTGVEWASNIDVPGTLDVTSTATFDSIASHPLGSAAAPTLTFTGDTNTGIYSPGADQVAISTNSAGRLFIDASGNVGVGVASPAPGGQGIHSHNSSAADSSLRLTNSATGATNGDGFAIQVASDGTAKLRQFENLAITFETNGTERMRLDSSGRLLIGTSSNLGGTVSIVGGGLYLSANDSNAEMQLTRASANSGSPLYYFNKSRGTYSSPTVVSDGDVCGTINFRGHDGSAYITGASISAAVDGTPGTSDMPGRLVFSTTADGAASPSERMRLDSSGRLGLGTSSPGTILDVRFGTSPATDNGSGLNALRCFTTSALAVDTGGAISFGGVYHSNGDVAAFGQIAGRKENSTSNNLSGYLQFATNAAGGTMTERMRLDSSGRVGIGNTVPGSYLFNQLVVGSSGDQGVTIVSGTTNTGSLAFARGTVGTDAYMGLIQYSHTSDFMRFFTGGGERARIDSSGRLLVGTSTVTTTANTSTNNLLAVESTNNYLGVSFTANSNDSNGSYLVLKKSRGTTAGSNTVVQSGDEIGNIFFEATDGSASRSAAAIRAFVDATPGASDMPGRLVFSTCSDGSASPSERARITNKGYTKFTSSVSYRDVSGLYHEFVNDAADWTVIVTNTNASPTGIRVNYNTDSNNTGSEFLYCVGNNTVRAAIRSNGGLANYSANNVNLSDINSKKDITPAAGTWDCLKEWEIVNFRYKDQPDNADLNMGVIAQQVAESCPEVITVFQEAKEATETEPAQEERLGVKDQQMMWMAIKALQEAQLRIETLEAEVAALKGA